MKQLTSWLKRLDWKKYLLGSVVGLGVGVVFFDLFGELTYYKNTLLLKLGIIISYLCLGITIYKFNTNQKRVITKIVIALLTIVLVVLGYFLATIVAIYLGRYFVDHLKEQLLLNSSLIWSIETLLVHLLPITIVVLIIRLAKIVHNHLLV